MARLTAMTRQLVRRHTGQMRKAEPVPPRVTDEDRRRFERQVAALRQIENDDDGSPEWRTAVVEHADDERAKRGAPRLKTEGELHRRARDLGLTR